MTFVNHDHRKLIPEPKDSLVEEGSETEAETKSVLTEARRFRGQSIARVGKDESY